MHTAVKQVIRVLQLLSNLIYIHCDDCLYYNYKYRQSLHVVTQVILVKANNKEKYVKFLSVKITIHFKICKKILES